MRIVSVAVLALFLYFSFWPVPITPHSWQPAMAPAYSGDYAVNDKLAGYESLAMPGYSGPEGVLVASDGNVYATTDQGAILRWRQGEGEAELVANTGGRPLGIAEGVGGELWLADAFIGLMKLSPAGELTTVLTEVEGLALHYANDVVVADDGKLYLTDSTARFPAKDYGSTYEASLLDLLEHGRSGRLIEYDPAKNRSRVLMNDLSFANGVAIDPLGSYLLIAETAEYRIWKFWLRGERAGQREIVIDNLPGFPDNLHAGLEGRYWLGFTSPRLPMVDWLSDKPVLRKLVQRLPAFVRPKALHYGHVIAIDGEGRVVANLQDPAAGYPLTTGVSESEDYLYISSLVAAELARLPKNTIND